MTDLTGKIAIVTGGAGGMGRSHALWLARLGADVAVIDIDLKVASRFGEKLTAASVQEEILKLGVRGLGLMADLADHAQATAAIARVAQEFGRIDILVNNAGGAIVPIGKSSPTQSSPADTQLLFAANFQTMLNCCQAAAPHLIKTRGVIVNTSTTGVDVDIEGGLFALYAAAKAAVMRYTRSLAVELGPKGVRVNCVAPGVIETARVMSQAAARNVGTPDQAKAIPLRRLGKPEDVSAVVEFLVSDLSAYVTGECIRVCGGPTLVVEPVHLNKTL